MSLSEQKKKILGYIREGRNTNAAFADILGISSPQANLFAEELEQEGYVVRKSYIGIERFNWLLTDNGVKQLDPLSENESKLIEAGINLNQLKIIAYASQHPGAIAGQICDYLKIPGGEMVTNLCHLVDNGFVVDSGIIRRKTTVTEKGQAILEKFADSVNA